MKDWFKALLARTQPAQAESRADSADDPELIAVDPPHPLAHDSLTGSSDAIPTEWAKGDVVLGLYEVKDINRSGGMGLVYRVTHRGWGIDLAMKSPRPELFTTEAQRRSFTRECETWVRLGLHRYLVCCHYVRRVQGVPHIFAEFVEGGSLADWIESRKLYVGDSLTVLRRIIDIAIQTAWGLDYAHRLSIVHQDFKPSNVMMTAAGQAKVTDFGLSKASAVIARSATASSARRAVLVSSGGMTPAYRSPEQARGEHLSPRTDVWSWAVSVLEMCCEDILWEDGQIANHVLQLLLKGRLTARRLPRPMSSLLEQCLNPKAEMRPTSMSELVRRLIEIHEETFQEPYQRVDIIDTLEKGDDSSADVAAADVSNRALSLLDLGHYQEAADILGAWLERHPGDPVPWCNAALIRVGLGKSRLAQVAREYAATIAPSRPQWHATGADATDFLTLLRCHHIQGGRSEVCALRWRPDRTLIAGFRDGVIKCLTLRDSGWEAPTIVSTGRSGLSGLWFVEDLLIAGFDDGTLQVLTGEGTLVSSTQLKPTYEYQAPVVPGTTRPLSRCVRGVVCAAGSSTATVLLEGADALEVDIPSLSVRRERHEQRDITVSVAMPDDLSFVVVGELQGYLRTYADCFAAANARVEVRQEQQMHSSTGRSLGIEERIAEISTVACSHDGALIAVGTRHGCVLLWHTTQIVMSPADAQIDPARRWYFDQGPIRDLQFSTDGHHLFCIDGEDALTAVDTTTMERRVVSQVRCSATTIAPNSETSVVAVGCSDGSISFEPMTQPAWTELPLIFCRPWSFDEHESLQKQLDALSTRAEAALQASRYGESANFAREGAALAQSANVDDERFQTLLLRLPARRRLLARLQVDWSVSAFDPTREYGSTGVERPLLNDLIMPASGGTLLAATDGGIHCFGLTHGDRRGFLDFQQVRGLAYHEDTDTCLACTVFGGVGLIRHMSGGEGARIQNVGSLNTITQIDCPQDIVAACGSDYGYVVFRRTNGQLESIRVMPRSIQAIAASPDSSWIAVGGLDDVIGCMDVATRRALGSLRGHSDTIRSLVFHPAGELLASGADDGIVRLWDLTRGEVFREYSGHPVASHGIAFSHDGEWLAFGDREGAIRVVHVAEDVECPPVPTEHGDIAALAFTTDSGALVVGHRSGVVSRWRLNWEFDASPSSIADVQRKRLQFAEARRRSARPPQST